MRGEKFTTCTAMLTIRGSPPRARGEVRIPRRMAGPARITPACAGRSRRALPGSHRRAGSPPRARGEAGRAAVGEQGRGITPACAGRRCGGINFSPHHVDHPRVRGEKWFANHASPRTRGSPPRARGEEDVDHLHVVHAGITPACAGRSSPDEARRIGMRDHPRVRGEKR